MYAHTHCLGSLAGIICLVFQWCQGQRNTEETEISTTPGRKAPPGANENEQRQVIPSKLSELSSGQLIKASRFAWWRLGDGPAEGCGCLVQKLIAERIFGGFGLLKFVFFH